MATIVIRKSLFGLLVIYLGGIVLFTAVLAAIAFTRPTGWMFLFLTLAGIAVIVGTLAQAVTYQLSAIVLTDTELQVTSWGSLLFSNQATAEWNQVQQVDVQRTNIFSYLFNFGTLLVTTAGSAQNLRLPYVPNVEHWREVMQQRADVAVQPVHNT